MDGDLHADRAVVRIRDVLSPRRWTLWQQRRRLIFYFFFVGLIVVLTTAHSATATQLTSRELVTFGALAGMGTLQAELGRQIERLRRLMSGTPHVNLTSVWTFAGVLLLPPVLVTALIAVLYLHLGTRSLYRIRRVPPFRTILNGGLVVISCQLAHLVLARLGLATMYAAQDHGWRSVGILAVTVAAYFLIETITVIPMLTIPSWSFQAVLGGWGDNLLEIATLCLGTLVALAFATLPALALMVLPPLIVLHRAVLVKQLEIAATTDEKTGLFNTNGWHTLAARELARARRSPDAGFGVLMVDLDHFKRINDQHGHLAGDTVLRAVAAAITSAVREYDSVGRFGGEEFVVLLPNIQEHDVRAVAERIRHAIGCLTVEVPTGTGATLIDDLSASIGVATYPDAGSAIDRLIQAADQALYSAKNTGRNKVVSIMDVA
jgi:diguanylate cyclase (GGDEF)-like protein